jgi:hypothetical protein
MASAECEPIRGFGDRAPAGSRGRAPGQAIFCILTSMISA